MSKDKKKQLGVLGLIVALVMVLIGGLVFMGAVAGWFDDPKVVINGGGLVEQPELKDISIEEYNSLVDAKNSFVVFIDQETCTTADRLRGYVRDYINEKGIVVYRMMFEYMKETSLHDYVKYYPSVVIIDRGEVRYYLRADSDEDSDMYNDYSVFKNWVDEKIEVSTEKETSVAGFHVGRL